MLWTHLINANQIYHIIEESNSTPCVIFKHSRRSPVSNLAKRKLETEWPFSLQDVKAYYLNAKKYHRLSRLLSSVFGTGNELPQLIIIADGKCIYSTCQSEIEVRELQDLLAVAA